MSEQLSATPFEQRLQDNRITPHGPILLTEAEGAVFRPESPQTNQFGEVVNPEGSWSVGFTDIEETLDTADQEMTAIELRDVVVGHGEDGTPVVDDGLLLVRNGDVLSMDGGKFRRINDRNINFKTVKDKMISRSEEEMRKRYRRRQSLGEQATQLEIGIDS